MLVSSVGRSYTETVGGCGDYPPGGYPLWARWSDELDQRHTLGLEEEVMLLEPSHWSLAQGSDQVLSWLSDELSPLTSPETHAAVVELATGIHTHVGEAAAELGSLRNRLGRELEAMGLATTAAGTHPQTLREETEVSSAVRYRHLGDSPRVLTRREPTMALHVHVGVPAAEDAIRLLNGLRRNTPVLLALSANSPFWQGRDGGFACRRTLIFQAFPRTGPPRFFKDSADYVEAVDALIASDAVPNPTFLWWDVRLQPVRVTLNAPAGVECRPHALALGCAGALDRVQRLAAATGPTGNAPSRPAAGVWTTGRKPRGSVPRARRGRRGPQAA